MFDVIIVGGGASGLTTAIMVKEKAPDLNVAIIEQLDRVGKKISITGNGRCNITNNIISSKHYYSSDLSKAMDIIDNFSLSKTRNFFSSIGVELFFENNKAYPRSFQASSVVDALRFAAQKLGIQLLTSTIVSKITKKGVVFNVDTKNTSSAITTFYARNVVIATGGLAGGSKLGSNGNGYKFLADFGHKLVPQSPVIVQVKTENDITRSLKGIKVNALVKVLQNGNVIATDFGEVLFCDYGLSGPPILQLSRHCTKNTNITLDLFNDLDYNSLVDLISNRRSIFHDHPLTEFFAGLLHKRIGQVVLKVCGISLSNTCSQLTDIDCKKIAKTLKGFKFNVLGNTGFVNAQATSGGASLKDFDNSLMSKHCNGLFAVGEVLDVDGDCGGYNLQWAWSSANTVANSIISFLGR